MPEEPSLALLLEAGVWTAAWPVRLYHQGLPMAWGYQPALGALSNGPPCRSFADCFDAASITYEPSITPATESADAIRAT